MDNGAERGKWTSGDGQAGQYVREGCARHILRGDVSRAPLLSTKGLGTSQAHAYRLRAARGRHVLALMSGRRGLRQLVVIYCVNQRRFGLRSIFASFACTAVCNAIAAHRLLLRLQGQRGSRRHVRRWVNMEGFRALMASISASTCSFTTFDSAADWISRAATSWATCPPSTRSPPLP